MGVTVAAVVVPDGELAKIGSCDRGVRDRVGGRSGGLHFIG